MPEKSSDVRGRTTVESDETDPAGRADQGQLVAWLLHDLKGPLTGIRAMAESLEDGIAHEPTTYYRQIQDEVLRMTRMVDDLSELVRSDAHRETFDPRPTALAPLLAATLVSAGPVADSCGVILDATGPQDLVATVDPAELSRALSNLILNAIRYTPSGGRVTVTTTVGAGALAIAVDDGCGGITQETVTRAFEPRWQGPPSRSITGRTVCGEGQGLGLTIVRTIVEAHRGAVSVQNNDRGCRFLVSLPATA